MWAAMRALPAATLAAPPSPEADVKTALLSLMRGIDRLNRFVGRAMLWPVLLSVFIAVGNAMSRKFFSISSNGWLEVQWHLFALAFLGCGGYVLLVDEHVRIDVLSRRWSARARAVIDVVGLAFVALPTAVLIAVHGWTIFMHALHTHEASFNAGGLYVAPLYLCIPLGMGLLGLQVVSELIRRAGFLLGWHGSGVLSEADLPAVVVVAAGIGDAQ